MDQSGLRRRKHVEEPVIHQDAVQTIASLDVFPKVPADFKKQTNCGALLTIICTTTIVLLVVAEYLHYRMPDFDYVYSVDKDFSTKLPLSIDMTVAMPCEAIGADIVDLVNDNIDIDGGLNEEPTYFELSAEDAKHWEMRRTVNKYISEEYHALHKLLWMQGYKSAWSLPAPRKLSYRTGKRPDACRFFGLVHVNKMAGNLHVLAGKALHGADLHAHISLFTSEAETNFSHRIERLGFGAHEVAIVNPLDGEQKITNKHSVSYQYNIKGIYAVERLFQPSMYDSAFIVVVPTEVLSRSANAMTYQYGVQEMERVLNHSTGSHGIPGIFIKYDINPLRITVIERPVPIIHFLVRVCGVVGGIFATTGIFSSLIQHILRFMFGKSSDPKIPVHRQESHQSSFKPLSPNLPANALFSHIPTADDHSDARYGDVKTI